MFRKEKRLVEIVEEAKELSSKYDGEELNEWKRAYEIAYTGVGECFDEFESNILENLANSSSMSLPDLRKVSTPKEYRNIGDDWFMQAIDYLRNQSCIEGDGHSYKITEKGYYWFKEGLHLESKIEQEFKKIEVLAYTCCYPNITDKDSGAREKLKDFVKLDDVELDAIVEELSIKGFINKSKITEEGHKHLGKKYKGGSQKEFKKYFGDKLTIKSSGYYGYRPDVGYNVRSILEANVGRVLNLGEMVEYEPRGFKFTTPKIPKELDHLKRRLNAVNLYFPDYHYVENTFLEVKDSLRPNYGESIKIDEWVIDASILKLILFKKRQQEIGENEKCQIILIHNDENEEEVRNIYCVAEKLGVENPFVEVCEYKEWKEKYEKAICNEGCLENHRKFEERGQSSYNIRNNLEDFVERIDFSFLR